MTIEQIGVIDVISINDEEDSITLHIADHLEWDDKNEKLLLLQEKINSYLAFIEGGEIAENYQGKVFSQVIISVASKFSPSKEGLKFLKIASKV